MAGSLLVIAADVVQAPNDKQQIEPMLEKLAAVFGRLPVHCCQRSSRSRHHRVPTCGSKTPRSHSHKPAGPATIPDGSQPSRCPDSSSSPWPKGPSHRSPRRQTAPGAVREASHRQRAAAEIPLRGQILENGPSFGTPARGSFAPEYPCTVLYAKSDRLLGRTAAAASEHRPEDSYFHRR